MFQNCNLAIHPTHLSDLFLVPYPVVCCSFNASLQRSIHWKSCHGRIDIVRVQRQSMVVKRVHFRLNSQPCTFVRISYSHEFISCVWRVSCADLGRRIVASVLQRFCVAWWRWSYLTGSLHLVRRCSQAVWLKQHNIIH
jgi:hypothetical protein